ncbi:MAG: 4Fe-4S dicluster domain-containing protein [Candidatus Dormibacteraeota bacterium]|uniref:Glycolate oxidase iron-sulfur subunit n=1 Tax=Candidatus Amunia macphersoniae TaxID=3127014 RepID=A0A934NJB1_9BACT|nr:4Fe-4S dicluster domain-containing protein [Candidatus Dormibacteraeota bacterium]
MSTAFDDHHPPAADLIADCVHCGFCLPACPTYQLWGEEMDSPRGRILLMDAARRGEVDLNDTVVQHWDACLGCMACETACPSGVRYGRLIEQTRQQVERRYRRPWPERMYRAVLFAMLPYPLRLRVVAQLLALYQDSGARRVLRRSGVIRRLPQRLRELEALAPALSRRRLEESPPERSAVSVGRARLRVTLLRGCVQRAFFGDVSAATARVLAAFGCEVSAPRQQGCCGALELHSGREQAALARARALIAALEAGDPDRIAVDSAGCGASMKEYGELLADDPIWAERAAAFSARVRDVSEILDELGPPALPMHPLPMRLAYHDACHLAHAQRVRAQPRRALSAIPGVELIPLDDADLCCGSAGVYNLVEPGPAADLGRRKAASIATAAPQALAAGNPGCLLQIGAHLSLAGQAIPTFHPVELLDASLRGIPVERLLADRSRLLAIDR